MTFALFDFQEQALEAEARHRIEKPDETRLAIVMPTGTGKAYTLCGRAVRYLDSFEGAGNRVLVLAHTDELVSQLEASARFVASQWPATPCTCTSYCAGGDGPERYCPEHGEKPVAFTVGVVKADRDETDADIIIASRQTLEDPARRARIDNVGLVIVDECHIGYTAYEPILRHFGCMPDCDHAGRDEHGCWDCRNTGFTRPPVPALGFTATLERSDGAGLGRVWQDVAFTRDVSWAVRKGYLKQPIGYRLEIELPHPAESGLAPIFYSDPTALDAQICDSIAPERIVEKWQELASDRQTIVFAPLVRSARVLSNYFADAGVTVGVVYGDQPDWQRRETVRAFKAGEIQVLCNAMVLTAGFDHPKISCVIVARPTKSRTLFIQMAGRGLRRVPGVPVEDQDCILITLADTTTDICSVADLSDRPLDRKADGPLTAMEDEWDIGRDLEEAGRHWAGRVDATRFDPIVARSSKVWARTKAGYWFLPISTQQEYVFLLGEPDGNTDIYLLTRPARDKAKVARIHAGLPDLEIAMSVAEDEATERGGDLGALLADRTRPWRNQKPGPNDRMIYRADRLGLADEVNRIMISKTGGKAGKISDLIRRVEATRSIERAVQSINSRKATA